MRKLSFYMCTAATILSVGGMANTAYGATANMCGIPGGGAIVIGGGSLDDLRSALGQLQGNMGGACSGNLFSGGNNSCSNNWISGGNNGGCQGSQVMGNGNCSGNWNLGSDWSCGNNSGMGLPGISFPGILFPGNGNGGCDNPDIGQEKPVDPKPDTPDKPDVPDKPDTPDKPGSSDKPDNPDKPGSSDKPDTPDKPDVPDKPDNPDKPDVPDKPDTPDKENPGTGSTQDAYAAQVVELVNAERAKAGLSTLKVHIKAEDAAMVRAQEIQRNFSHTRPSGSGFYTALEEVGISYQSAGENIAYGQTSPQQVMNVWMNSSGHRANILSGNYTSIAVAHYRSASGVDYWVQLFLR